MKALEKEERQSYIEHAGLGSESLSRQIEICRERRSRYLQLVVEFDSADMVVFRW